MENNTTIDFDIFAVLKEWMSKNKVSYAEAGRRLKVNSGTLFSVLSGNRKPTYEITGKVFCFIVSTRKKQHFLQ